MVEPYSVLNDKPDPCAQSKTKNYGMCRKCRISLLQLEESMAAWTRRFLEAAVMAPGPE